MIDDLLKVLATEDATGFGVLLAGVVVFAVAIQREWLVTGPRWRGKVEELAVCRGSLESCNAETKATNTAMVDYRLDLVRCETERDHGWGDGGPRRPARRA